jgi:hypothetical protein
LNYFRPNQAVIYTYRDIEAVERSVFKMRHRFGLDEDDFDRFVVTPMARMYNRNLKAHAIRDTITERLNVKEVDWLFGQCNETVRQYMERHLASWMVLHADKKNFMMLKYDDLAHNFYWTMRKVAKFLGSNKTEFKDENRRVGWRAKGDNDWKKPGN